MTKKRLGDICEINPKDDIDDMELLVSFVSMQNVSDNGNIDTSDVRITKNVCKGFTSFAENDVLMAKITPCMENGKGAIAKGLINGRGYGSTEFFVIRPKHDLVLSKWIYYLTVRKQFRLDCERNMTGSAGQKRVPKGYLEKYLVTVPILKKQEKIVLQLDTIRSIAKKRGEQLVLLDNLIKSRFVEMFGTCSQYELLDDADIFISDGNYSSKYPTADEFVDEGVPFIRASNMVENTITDDEMYFISERKHEELLKGHVKPFDVLIATRGAGIGKIAVVPERHDDSNINAQIVLLRCNKKEYNPTYLSWYLKLRETQMKIQGLVSGSAQPQLPIKRLVQLELLKPEIEKQEEFASFVFQVDKLKVAFRHTYSYN